VENTHSNKVMRDDYHIIRHPFARPLKSTRPTFAEAVINKICTHSQLRIHFIFHNPPHH
jgi:hypothetical protein